MKNESGYSVSFGIGLLFALLGWLIVFVVFAQIGGEEFIVKASNWLLLLAMPLGALLGKLAHVITEDMLSTIRSIIREELESRDAK